MEYLELPICYMCKNVEPWFIYDITFTFNINNINK